MVNNLFIIVPANGFHYFASFNNTLYRNHLVKKIYNYLLIQLLVLSLIVPAFIYSQDHQEWSYNLNIYEVNVRQYSQEGTFAAFENHLDRLKNMGVGILWFMPVHPIGVQNRLGSLGSYYSVKDYYDINPEFGTLEDFKSLVNKIHEKGMYVMMDWVANHTAWDNNLTVTNPEFYTKDSAGNFIPPPGTNWSDVIDLDYSNTGLRNYMIDAMKFWVTEAGIDGFRFDAASWVPLDFWSSAITQLKSIKPDILLLAEADGTQYSNAGFDASFGWAYYGFGNGILKNLVNGTNNANQVNSYLQTQLIIYPEDHYRMFFTSNHDENSWYGTVYELFGAAAENFAVLSSTFHGIPLIYSGQEAGLNKRLLFFDKDLINWQPHPFYNMYSTLLHLKRNNKALWNGSKGGEFTRINTSDNSAVFSFLRQNEDDKVFGIFNLTGQLRTFVLIDSAYFDVYVNAFTADTVSFSSVTQLTLNAWEYKIYSKGENISEVNEAPNVVSYSLSQNYPNPLNPSTNIRYSVPQLSHVTIKVFDLLGNEIETLVNEVKPSGTYELKWNAADLPSGIYFYRLQSGGFIETKKMILLK
jgi:cyclomaltodextrinase / maltogenic alpha-amylase / neopullulanase